MKRLRQDLNYVTSAGLLVVVLAAILTGIVAHLWDLNDFVYHTYAGYVMVVFALVHVWLNWGRMVAYGRFLYQLPASSASKNRTKRTRVSRSRYVI